MTPVGDPERVTQNRVIDLFDAELGYRFLGDWSEREDNSNIEDGILSAWLRRCGHSDGRVSRVLDLLHREARNHNRGLYDNNKAVYSLLRYGVQVKESVGENTVTVPLIDWTNPQANDFAIAEEVTLLGQHERRPDIVLYINGIAVGVIELKNSRVNTELAKKPRECLEYLVVHELAHLIEPTHNERFLQILGQALPQWRHRRALLNRLPVRHEHWIY